MSTEMPPSRFPLIPITYSPDWDYSDHAATFGISMTLIHNVFIRCLNSIHEHAMSIPASSSDVIPFAGYALAWIAIIYAHHQAEEENIFPFLQTKFPVDMQENLDEHNIFMGCVGTLEGYLKQVYEKKEGIEWDGAKVRKLIEEFGDELVEHLHNEIPTLSPEKLRQFDKAELDNMAQTYATHIRAQPIANAHVLVAVHHDFAAYPSWPPKPALFSWIIRNIAFWRHYRRVHRDNAK